MPRTPYHEAIDALNQTAESLQCTPIAKAKVFKVWASVPQTTPDQNEAFLLNAGSPLRKENGGTHQFWTLDDMGKSVVLGLKEMVRHIHDAEISYASLGGRPNSIQHGGLSIE